MTIASEVSKTGPYICDGSITDFAFEFKVVKAEHLKTFLQKRFFM